MVNGCLWTSPLLGIWLPSRQDNVTAVGFEPEWMMDVHLSDWLLSRLCLAEFGESKVGKTAGSKVGVDLEWNDSALLGLEV